MERLLVGLPASRIDPRGLWQPPPGRKPGSKRSYLDWTQTGRVGTEAASPRVKAWAAECGIVFRASRRIPATPRPYGRCTACGGLGSGLQYVGPREALCWRCAVTDDEEQGPWWSLGKYACGIRLGRTDWRMQGARQRLLELGARRAQRARSTRDLVLLAAIATLVAPEVKKRVLLVRERQQGFWPAVQVVYPGALIDNLLAKWAYFDRFATL